MVSDVELDVNGIYKQYKTKIFGLFLTKTSNYELSKDLTAETITKIILKFKTKPYVKTTLDNYVYNTANNHYTDYLRKINRQRRIPEKLFTDYYSDTININDDIVDVGLKKNKKFDENQNCSYELNYDIKSMFDIVKKNMENSSDIFLKNFFELKYLKHLSDKQITNRLKINTDEIEKLNNQLVDFLKKSKIEELFT